MKMVHEKTVHRHSKLYSYVLSSLINFYFLKNKLYCGLNYEEYRHISTKLVIWTKL